MSKPELLITTYGLVDWQRANYHGNDIKLKSTPDINNAAVFRGLQRFSLRGVNEVLDDDDDTNTETENES